MRFIVWGSLWFVLKMAVLSTAVLLGPTTLFSPQPCTHGGYSLRLANALSFPRYTRVWFALCLTWVSRPLGSIHRVGGGSRADSLTIGLSHICRIYPEAGTRCTVVGDAIKIVAPRN
jgi:hypothetical protein